MTPTTADHRPGAPGTVPDRGAPPTGATDLAEGGAGPPAESRERHPAAAEAVWLEQDFPVSYGIFRLARVHRALAASQLSHLGLFPNQEILLVQLGAADGLSQKTLAHTLRVDHSTVAKSVARLERTGLVQRRRSSVDGRISLVELTAAGRALQEEIVAAWGRMDAMTTSGLTALERHQLFTLSAKVAEGLEAASREEDDPA